MECCILFSSPRKNGNTAAITEVFSNRMREKGASVVGFNLYEMELLPCTACRACQKDHTIFGCRQKDDMQKIFDALLKADIIAFATPVYSWYCTPPMKAVLDRMVYGMNKFYGEVKGPSLWRGKTALLITTCGYPVEKGADLLNEGIRRYCRHSKLDYFGMLAEHHLGYDTVFMDDEKRERAVLFADSLIEKLNSANGGL